MKAIAARDKDVPNRLDSTELIEGSQFTCRFVKSKGNELKMNNNLMESMPNHWSDGSGASIRIDLFALIIIDQ